MMCVNIMVMLQHHNGQPVASYTQCELSDRRRRYKDQCTNISWSPKLFDRNNAHAAEVWHLWVGNNGLMLVSSQWSQIPYFGVQVQVTGEGSEQ